jgi:organic radical activating enzyme
MDERKLLEVYPKEKYLAITWQVSDNCNYKCSYCNTGNWGKLHKNDGNQRQYIENLRQIIDNYKKNGYNAFKLYLSGGEPTIWKNLIPVVEFFKSYAPNNTVAINTNLSRATSWWKKHYHLFDDIVASFHIEQVDKDRYFQNSLFLCDKINYMCNKLLMHDERFWEVVEYGEMLKDKLPGYFIEWTPLFDEMSSEAKPWEYADNKKVEWLKEHQQLEIKFAPNKPNKENLAISYGKWSDGSNEFMNSNEVIIARQNFFSGWQCDIGDAVFINPAGIITMASCGVSGVVGSILSNVDEIRPTTITCNKFHCVCGTDIIIPKRKSNVQV